MSFFDRFKKKKKDENAIPDELTVHNLRKGYVLDYEMQSWEIRGVYDYDWGGNFFTKEYQIFSGTEVRYLHVEDDDELELSMSRKIKLKEIQGEARQSVGFKSGEQGKPTDIRRQIIDTDQAPQNIVFEGRAYKLIEESQGYFRDTAAGADDWAEFVNWEYEDAEEEHFVTVERWGETDIEAAAGRYLEIFEVGNFLPR